MILKRTIEIKKILFKCTLSHVRYVNKNKQKIIINKKRQVESSSISNVDRLTTEQLDSD